MLAPIRLLRPAMYHFFCHTLGLSLVPQQILHYFQLVISVWQDFKLRFILGSSPENRNALGSAVVDNLCQGRPRLKYGSFFFSVTVKVTFSLKNCHLEKKKKEREKKRLCRELRSSCLFYEWWYWVRCSRQNQSYISSEKPNWEKKKKKEMYT